MATYAATNGQTSNIDLFDFFKENTGVYANPDAINGLSVKEIWIEPILMNKVLGPYYDTEKPIDYFYDFRIVKYFYGVKSEYDIPEISVEW
jgi:hypothetical protein